MPKLYCSGKYSRAPGQDQLLFTMVAVGLFNSFNFQQSTDKNPISPAGSVGKPPVSINWNKKQSFVILESPGENHTFSPLKGALFPF